MWYLRSSMKKINISDLSQQKMSNEKYELP